MATPSRKGTGVGAADPALDDLEVELLLEAIRRRYGYDLKDYLRDIVRRRVRECMLASRIPSVARLQERILREPLLLERLLRRFSPPAPSLFGDAEYFKAFKSNILPLLKTYPFVRIWHMGCSTGEEVYALAILLKEAGIYSRSRIYATDLSSDAVAHARRGSYNASVIADYTENYARAGNSRSLVDYVKVKGSRLLMNPSLRKHIVFSEHNPATDGSFNEFQVIVCRDILANFSLALRKRVDQLVYDSLSRLGILVLGRSNSISLLPHEACFAALVETVGVYQKTGYQIDSKAC